MEPYPVSSSLNDTLSICIYIHLFLDAITLEPLAYLLFINWSNCSLPQFLLGINDNNHLELVCRVRNADLGSSGYVGRTPCPQAVAASESGSRSGFHWEKLAATTSPPAWLRSWQTHGVLWA